MKESLDQRCRHDNEFCMQKIREVRNMFGNKNSTQADFDDARRILGFILICNENESIINLTHATLDEMARREAFYIVRGIFSHQEEIKNEVRFHQWPGGTHWYATVGFDDVVDAEGNQKWDTKKKAIEAVDWYIKNQERI